MSGEKRQVRLVKLNWDEECRTDMLIKKGFEIKEKAFKGKEEKSMYGIYSPLFATDYEDENAFMERYSCKCKELQGKVYEGEICPICNTEVKFTDVDLKIYGWIIMKNHFIIQPILFKMIKSVIGDKILEEMLEYDASVEKDNIIIDKKSKNPFKGIGLIAFKEHFDEIMQYFKEKKKHKAELVDSIMDDKSKVFASCIPVYSSVLRPASFRNETFYFNSIDKRYSSVLSIVMSLNQSTSVSISTTEKRKRKNEMDTGTKLFNLQKRLMKLWELIFEQINQKDGHIKDQILGGRLNFSARNVIIPDPSLRADEIKLGYLAFLELYKYQIIAYLSKIHYISENEAYEQWFKATINFNPKIYEIMQYMIKKKKPAVIINRNPTINYGSILFMRIIEVKPDMDDFTMSIPIQILRVLNADFDGDILNIIALLTKKLVNHFDRTFNPRKNMFISRNDGLFNNDFNLLKDQLIGLYEFNNI